MSIEPDKIPLRIIYAVEDGVEQDPETVKKIVARLQFLEDRDDGSTELIEELEADLKSSEEEYYELESETADKIFNLENRIEELEDEIEDLKCELAECKERS